MRLCVTYSWNYNIFFHLFLWILGLGCRVFWWSVSLVTAPSVWLKLWKVTAWVMGGAWVVMTGFHHNQLCINHIFIIVSLVLAHNLQCNKYLLNVSRNDDLDLLIQFELGDSWLLVWHPGELLTFILMRENFVMARYKRSVSVLHKGPFNSPLQCSKSSCVESGTL